KVRSDDDGQREPRERGTTLDRAVAKHLLQVEREQEELRERDRAQEPQRVNKSAPERPSPLERSRPDKAALASCPESPREAGLHFNPKVAGSIPARPIEYSGVAATPHGCV